MKGRVKERWGRLTDDDLTVIAGRRDQLESKIWICEGASSKGNRKIVTARWGRTLESRLKRSAPGFKTCLPPSSGLLKSSSLVPAQEQQALSLMPRKRSIGTRLSLSPSHWVWDF
jgi:hypothetical protein